MIWPTPPGPTVIFTVAFLSAPTSLVSTELAWSPPPIPLSSSAPASRLATASPLASAAAEATLFTARSSLASRVTSPDTFTALPLSAMVALVSAFSTVTATLPATPTLFAPAPEMAWVSMTWPVAAGSDACSARSKCSVRAFRLSLDSVISAAFAPARRASVILALKSPLESFASISL